MPFGNSQRPKRKLDESALYLAALAALGRRAYSIHEMRKWLAGRAERVEDVGAVLAKLKQYRYIDDQRYAADFARTHAQSRGQGRFRIARELRARGVPDRHIDPAVEVSCTTEDEVAKVRSKIEKKVRQLKGPLDERKRASLYRSLLRSGFPGDAISKELNRVRSEARIAAADLAEQESVTDANGSNESHEPTLE